jgi:hypothetical protein
MDSRLSFQSTFLVLVFIIFLVSVEVPVSLCSYDWYSSCSNRFNCGDITDVGYPFWGDDRPDACGHPDLKLNCSRNITTIEIMKVTYRVLAANTSTKILKIVREDYLVGGICSEAVAFLDTAPDSELFDYGIGYGSITLFYGCPPTNLPPVFSCNIGGIANNSGYIAGGALGRGPCAQSVVVPVRTTHYKDTGKWSIMEDAIKEGFDVKWKEDTAACSACTGSKGVCGYDPSTKQTTCYSRAAGASQAPLSKSGMSLIFEFKASDRRTVVNGPFARKSGVL